MPLSRRQQNVLDALCRREAAGEPPPSLDELCVVLGLASRGSLHKHVTALVAAGWVEPMAGRQRGVTLTRERRRELHRLPLLGTVAAGTPLDTFADDETIEVPPQLRTSDPCFAVRVEGDSMIDEGILDGDTVIVERRESARAGDLVIALVDQSEVTLKRYRPVGSRVRLEPANPRMAPWEFAAERVRIQGVVVGQMRRYQRRG